jgi:flagellar biosynthesis regulator FlaF
MNQGTLEILAKAGEVFVLALAVLGTVIIQYLNARQNNKGIIALSGAITALSNSSDNSAKALERMQESTDRNIAVIEAHDGRVKSMNETIDGAISAMTATVEQRNSQINAIPGKVREIMSEDIQDLKDKNLAIIDEIKTLHLSINQRIEALYTTIPTRVIDPLKQEIAALTLKIDLLLDAQQPESPAEPKPEETKPTDG